MNDALRELVIHRAAGRCEYCLAPEELSFFPFEIDHVIAQKHRGPTLESNLAWSCYYCNSYKGPNIAGWIPETNEVVRLYHPRRDQWTDHFHWLNETLQSKTLIGRVTIAVLEINHPEAIAMRQELLANGISLAPNRS